MVLSQQTAVSDQHPSLCRCLNVET